MEGCGEGGGQREREKEGFERIGSDLLSRSYPLPPSLASPSSWPAKRINTDHVVCSGNAERTADPNPRACNNLSQPLNIYIYTIFFLLTFSLSSRKYLSLCPIDFKEAIELFNLEISKGAITCGYCARYIIFHGRVSIDSAGER